MKNALTILKYIILFIPIILVLYFDLFNFGIFSKSNIQPPELISDMDHDAKIRPQSESKYFKDSTIQRAEIDNTFPIQSEKYSISQIDFGFADSILKNPLEKNEKTLFIGKHLFENFCTYCHGADGRGNGKIITDVVLEEDEEGFPGPPDLTEKRTRGLSDARIYHILSAGQNLMFAYNDRLNPEKRWALVNYIRKLQKDAEKVNK
jgi:hypothetical protein